MGHSRVTVVPVLDLAHDPYVPQHDPPPRMAEQIRLRDHTGCVFPDCNRDVRSSDLDHVVPYPRGSTRPSNLAPLCRRHHRAKTARAWSYERVDDAYRWSGPHGQLVIVSRGSSVRIE